MATMAIDMSDDLLGDLLSSDFEDIAQEAIKACIPEAEQAVKDSVRSVIKDKSRTELIESFQATNIMKSKDDGMVAFVRAKGKPKRGGRRKRGDRARGTRAVSNNDIAFWLEYGNSHQGAKPFIGKAADKVRDKFTDTCQEILNKKTGAT